MGNKDTVRAGARLALVVTAHVSGTSRVCLALNSPPLASLPGEAAPEEVWCRPPREGLECLLVKMGRTGPLVEPRRGPHAGKSGDPRSQDADSSTWPLGRKRPNVVIIAS